MFMYSMVVAAVIPDPLNPEIEVKLKTSINHCRRIIKMLHGDRSGGFAPSGTLPALDGGENSKLQKVT
jgi:hypothetical protein